MASEDGAIHISQFLEDCGASPYEMRVIAESTSSANQDGAAHELLDPSVLVSMPPTEISQENLASLARKTSLATLQDVLMDTAPKRGRFTHRGRCRADCESETATRTAKKSERAKNLAASGSSLEEVAALQ